MADLGPIKAKLRKLSGVGTDAEFEAYFEELDQQLSLEDMQQLARYVLTDGG